MKSFYKLLTETQTVQTQKHAQALKQYLSKDDMPRYMSLSFLDKEPDEQTWNQEWQQNQNLIQNAIQSLSITPNPDINLISQIITKLNQKLQAMKQRKNFQTSNDGTSYAILNTYVHNMTGLLQALSLQSH